MYYHELRIKNEFVCFDSLRCEYVTLRGIYY
jgi:hypothetical protein